MFLLAVVFISRSRQQFFDRGPKVANEVPVRYNREQAIMFVCTGLMLALLTW
jgi:hypothetical protein